MELLDPAGGTGIGYRGPGRSLYRGVLGNRNRGWRDRSGDVGRRRRAQHLADAYADSLLGSVFFPPFAFPTGGSDDRIAGRHLEKIIWREPAGALGSLGICRDGLDKHRRDFHRTCYGRRGIPAFLSAKKDRERFG